MKTLFIAVVVAIQSLSAQTSERVIVERDGWKLIGDLVTPASKGRVPAVLMLNKAADNRTVYAKLAEDLAVRGIGSLRLDLRGHGESTNLGIFVPGEEGLKLIAPTDRDIVAAHQWLGRHPGIDSLKIAIIGASYSGEKMMDAARSYRYAQAYVALSPGSLTDESIDSVDSLKLSFLYIAAKNERHLKEVTAAVIAMSQTMEVLIIPGSQHATRILESRPDIAERVAVWLKMKLSE